MSETRSKARDCAFLKLPYPPGFAPYSLNPLSTQDIMMETEHCWDGQHNPNQPQQPPTPKIETVALLSLTSIGKWLDGGPSSLPSSSFCFFLSLVLFNCDVHLVRLGIKSPWNHSGATRVQLEGFAVRLEGLVYTPSAVLTFVIHLKKSKGFIIPSVTTNFYREFFHLMTSRAQVSVWW